MAYNEVLADRVREKLVDILKVTEKKMFRGITFMVNEKMCISVSGDELLCRVGPGEYEHALENGCRAMIRGGKQLKDFVFVPPEQTQNDRDLDRWIGLCLNFNDQAVATKKRGKSESPEVGKSGSPKV